MSTAIKVENLSKIYRLGEIGTGTISRDLERWYKTKLLGKEDPFLKIGESNDRSKKGASDIVYSLKDINFEIEQGDAVGIIGRNGAGKSTLLKILSRVTTPTTGKINIKGRVASLLEVGTGFHPELTGRENIYLNGAILGMRKKEIDRKLEEIIDFSGVERYIDTPVKRYSSGMYVRLAFAVAAHLESEILIVDEVLAVGDAEFQKKCLGKMNEVSKGEGRTVLFVSHNMEAITSLCYSSILLENGSFIAKEKSNEVIGKYIKKGFIDSKSNINLKKIDLEDVQIFNISLNGQSYREIEINQGSDLIFSFELQKNKEPNVEILFNVEIKTIDGQPIGCFGNEFQKRDIKLQKEKYKIEVILGECGWKKGEYSVSIYFQLGLGLKSTCVYEEDLIILSVKDPIFKSNFWNQFINQQQHGLIPIIWENISCKTI
jgi:lipopolysaccharide transport system ATP-binding protein